MDSRPIKEGTMMYLNYQRGNDVMVIKDTRVSHGCMIHPTTCLRSDIFVDSRPIKEGTMM